MRSALNVKLLSLLHICNAASLEFDPIWDNLFRFISNFAQKSNFDITSEKFLYSIKPLTGPWLKLKKRWRTLRIAAKDSRQRQVKWIIRSGRIDAFQIAPGSQIFSSRLIKPWSETWLITVQSGGICIIQKRTRFLNFMILLWYQKISIAWVAVLMSSKTILSS